MKLPETTYVDVAPADATPAIARKNLRGYANAGILAVQWIADLSPGRIKEVTDYALARWAADGRLRDIADELGTSQSALNRALLKYRMEDWREIQIARALTLLETAKEELESAAPDAVPRARERLKSAQWDLERLSRRLFGVNDTTPSTSGITISLNIGGSRHAPIDATVVDATVVGEGSLTEVENTHVAIRDSFFDPPDSEIGGGRGGS